MFVSFCKCSGYFKYDLHFKCTFYTYFSAYPQDKCLFFFYCFIVFSMGEPHSSAKQNGYYKWAFISKRADFFFSFALFEKKIILYYCEYAFYSEAFWIFVQFCSNVNYLFYFAIVNICFILQPSEYLFCSAAMWIFILFCCHVNIFFILQSCNYLLNLQPCE